MRRSTTSMRRRETTLLEAMRAAADRDRIAWQYANGFADIFDLGLTTLGEARARSADAALGTLAVYAAFLAAFPDSHIARKHGRRRRGGPRRGGAF